MIRAYTGARIRDTESPFLAAGRGDELMQRAAHGLATICARLLGERGRVYGSRVVLLVGAGNNGGDALFAGAVLAGRGAAVTAVMTADRHHEPGAAALRRAGGRLLPLTEASAAQLVGAASSADLVVDGILGTGAKGGLRGPAADFARELSAAGTKLLVACDLPSGLDASTGRVGGPVLHADVTVTFSAAKSGLLAGAGARAAGSVEVVPIGIEDSLPAPDLRRLEGSDLAALWPSPGAADHKYSRGVLGVVAGSAQYPGAALLCTAAAVATGAGMVRYLGPREVARLINLRTPEAVCSEGDIADTRVQAWLAGPGATADPDQLRRARDVLASGLPAVLDAGALEAVPDRVAPHVVLTPHAGELAVFLTNRGDETSREEVEAEPLEFARRAAAACSATVLLKGATTIVAAPSGTTFSQAEGTPWLATAGSGDTLAGILGALVAHPAPDAVFEQLGIAAEDKWAAIAAMAASIHGRAAALAGAPLHAGELPDHLRAVRESLDPAR